MARKTKHLRIRITEQQLVNLNEAIIREHKSTSEVVRAALSKYIKESQKKT